MINVKHDFCAGQPSTTVDDAKRRPIIEHVACRVPVNTEAGIGGGSTEGADGSCTGTSTGMPSIVSFI